MKSANLEYVILAGSLLSRTKTLGRLAASLCRSLPYLVDTGSSPRPRAGGRRVQLPGEAAFDSRSRRLRTYELRASTRRERVRCAARLHAYAHTDCLCPHACTPEPSPLLTVILRVLAWRSGRVRQVPLSSTSFWRGLYFTVQIHLCALSVHCYVIATFCVLAWVVLAVYIVD